MIDRSIIYIREKIETSCLSPGGEKKKKKSEQSASPVQKQEKQKLTLIKSFFFLPAEANP